MSNIDLSRERLEAIKADAARATDGPWEFEHDPDGQTIRVNAGSARTRWTTDEHGDRWPEVPSSYYSTDRIIDLDDVDYESDSVDEQQLLANAQHIANADPRFITALIDRCLALEDAVNRASDALGQVDCAPTSFPKWDDLPESTRQALASYV